MALGLSDEGPRALFQVFEVLVGCGCVIQDSRGREADALIKPEQPPAGLRAYKPTPHPPGIGAVLWKTR